MTRPVVLLLHDAWHGPWCWKGMVDDLDSIGIDTVVPELPLDTFANDVSAVRDAIAEARSMTTQQLVICAHSYAGAPLADAVDNPSEIAAIIYLAGIVPNAGDTIASIIGETRSVLREGIDISPDQLSYVLRPDRVTQALYNDVPAAMIRRIMNAEVLRPQAITTFFTEVGQNAPQVDSTYVRCTADNTIDWSVQTEMSRRCTTAIDWDTSHAPFFSQPELLISLLSETIASKHQLT